MMITVERLTAQCMLKEALPMMQEHYEEVPFGHNGRAFELDVELYEQLEEAGFLTILVAYDDGEIAGYIVLIASPSLHHKGQFDIQTDCFYVKPCKRRSGILKKLLAVAIAHCQECGIDTMRFGVNVNFKDAALVAKALGMKELQTEYVAEF